MLICNFTRIFTFNITRMQSKLTLTIEHGLIAHAKAYAKANGKSLSELIENYLKIILKEVKSDINLSTAVQSLKGSIKLPKDFDYKSELSKSLGRKHSS